MIRERPRRAFCPSLAGRGRVIFVWAGGSTGCMCGSCERKTPPLNLPDPGISECAVSVAPIEARSHG
jgi:hypothetical protein